MRLGRKNGRLLRKLVAGIWRLCTTCCTATFSGCGSCTNWPATTYLTVTYVSGFNWPGLNGLVIPVTRTACAGNPSRSTWTGSVVDSFGVTWSGVFGDCIADCRIQVTSSSGCFMNDQGTTVASCTVPSVAAHGNFGLGCDLQGCTAVASKWNLTVTP